MTSAADGRPGAAGIETLDDFVHTPARLSILSLLAPADWVLFSFLRDTIATSDSALSKQLSVLEDAGYVECYKDLAARRRTSVRMTDRGRTAFEAYLANLEALVARARGGASVAHDEIGPDREQRDAEQPRRVDRLPGDAEPAEVVDHD